MHLPPDCKITGARLLLAVHFTHFIHEDRLERNISCRP
ncbi:hypothetical protein EIO_0312 [Ketogulonicigenium vulgare Y25]|nr:hypothetical protein EIO_0312 [Ketogulonicigenium vulgare Y25]